jgi:hypothetical protein
MRTILVIAIVALSGCSQQECTTDTQSKSLTLAEAELTLGANGGFTVQDGVDRGTYDSCRAYCIRAPRLKSFESCAAPALSAGTWQIACRGQWENCSGNASPAVPAN